MKVMGLDVSSARTGVTILESIDGDVKRVFMGHIDLTKCEGLWEKVDFVANWFAFKKHTPDFKGIDHIAVEEALLGFSGGASSAQTITTLIRINALTSMLAYQTFCVRPVFIPAATARKRVGVKVMPVKKCGKPVKDQVFEHMLKHDLRDMASVWPMKKQTKKSIDAGKKPDYKDFCKDECDSYVIASAFIKINS